MKRARPAHDVDEVKRRVAGGAFDEIQLYVKLQMFRHGPVVVVSFELR